MGRPKGSKNKKTLAKQSSQETESVSVVSKETKKAPPLVVEDKRPPLLASASLCIATCGTYNNPAGKWKESTFSSIPVGTMFAMVKPDNIHYISVYRKVGTMELSSSLGKTKVWHDTTL